MAEKRCPASPGPISRDEQLAYGIYSPDLFDAQSGRLTSEAITLDKLWGKKGQHFDSCGASSGLSVARIQTAQGPAELRRTIDAIAGRPKKDGTLRASVGYATIGVADVTQIEKQALVVLDDGCECFTSHAVIRGSEGSKRAALRGARDKLVTQLNETIQRFTK